MLFCYKSLCSSLTQVQSIWDEPPLRLSPLKFRMSPSVRHYLAALHTIFQDSFALKLFGKKWHPLVLEFCYFCWYSCATILAMNIFFPGFWRIEFWRVTAFMNPGGFPFGAAAIPSLTPKLHMWCPVLTVKYTQAVPQWLEASTGRSKEIWSARLVVSTKTWEPKEAKIESQLISSTESQGKRLSPLSYSRLFFWLLAIRSSFFNVIRYALPVGMTIRVFDIHAISQVSSKDSM